jgi:DNA-binding MarR family transcriptional regulator
MDALVGVTTVTPEIQTRRLLTLMQAIEPWRNIRQTMPLQYVYTFLLVAAYPGRSVQELADLAGVGQTTMSRHLLDLGPRNRHMEPGWGLVSIEAEYTDLRRHLVNLTPRGKALSRQLAEIMERGN